MQLRGQGNRGAQAGYAMAALLVAMTIMAVMMTVAMPVWKQASQREKEEELVFRGQQYVHAIGLFKRKFANASPPNLDVLVDQRFLRKKYKDPITNDDFQPLTENQGTASGISGPQGGRGTATPGATALQPTAPTPASAGARPLGTSAVGTPGAGAPGGIIGVTSKSKDKSIRLYNGRSHYNEWAFVFTQQVQQPGVGGAGGVGAPGIPGQRGQPQGPPGGSTFPTNGRGRGTGRGDQTPSPGSRGFRGFSDPSPSRGRGPG
jgi:type II secretory pathway pseudopilin PulG